MKTWLKLAVVSSALFLGAIAQAENVAPPGPAPVDDGGNFLEKLQQELQKLSGGPQQAQSADASNLLDNMHQQLQGGSQRVQSA